MHEQVYTAFPHPRFSYSDLPALVRDQLQDISHKLRFIKAPTDQLHNAEALLRQLSHLIESSHDLAQLGRQKSGQLLQLFELGRLVQQQLDGQCPDELEALLAVDGMGMETVRKIYRHRAINTPADLWNEIEGETLLEVPGIGRATLDKARDHLAASLAMAKPSRPM